MSAMTGVTGTRIGSCLVVTVTQDLSGGVLDEVRRVTLVGIERDGARAAILELSAVPFMDSHEFAEIRGVLRMANLLGARAMLVGLKPGIIMHLMDADVDATGVSACLGLDEALQRLNPAETSADG